MHYSPHRKQEFQKEVAQNILQLPMAAINGTLLIRPGQARDVRKLLEPCSLQFVSCENPNTHPSAGGAYEVCGKNQSPRRVWLLVVQAVVGECDYPLSKHKSESRQSSASMATFCQTSRLTVVTVIRPLAVSFLTVIGQTSTITVSLLRASPGTMEAPGSEASVDAFNAEISDSFPYPRSIFVPIDLPPSYERAIKSAARRALGPSSDWSERSGVGLVMRCIGARASSSGGGGAEEDEDDDASEKEDEFQEKSTMPQASSS